MIVTKTRESEEFTCNKYFQALDSSILHLQDRISVVDQWDWNKVIYVTWNLIHLCSYFVGFPSPHAHCSIENMSLLVKRGVDVDMPIW